MEIRNKQSRGFGQKTNLNLASASCGRIPLGLTWDSWRTFLQPEALGILQGLARFVGKESEFGLEGGEYLGYVMVSLAGVTGGGRFVS